MPGWLTRRAGAVFGTGAAPDTAPPGPPGDGPRDRKGLLDKLRRLVSHQATSEMLRRMARAKLDILSPRSPWPMPGSPRRRASDRVPAAPRQLVATAYGAAEPGGDGRNGEPPRRAEEAHPNLDIRA